MLVRDFMKPNPPLAHLKSRIKDVVQIFYRYKENAVPIVDIENKLCGIMTQADLVEALVNQISLNAPVDTVMTKSVIFIHPDNTLEEAWGVPVNHLPVVDYENHVLGVLNRSDFTDIFYHEACRTKNCLEKILELSYSGIVAIDTHGVITSMNDIAAELFNVSVEDSVGRRISDVVTNCRALEVVHGNKTIMHDVLEINDKKLPINRAPICDGYKVVGAISIIRNIMIGATTTESEDYMEMKQKYEIMEAIFETMKHGIIFVDTKDIIRLANSAYEEMMGIPKLELVGQSAEEKVPNSRMHIVLKTGVPEIGRFQQLLTGRQVVVNRVPIFKDGKIIGGIGEAVFKDIHEVETLLKRGRIMSVSDSLQQGTDKKRLPEALDFEQIIGCDATMVRAKALAAKVAVMDTTVLIQGESGTGKDLFAQAIHNTSNRKDKKFVAINCAAIPAELLEAELFGYDEGAFTGAKRGGKKGKFELAEGGTLFLDEIGDMPLTMQAKLLRVMQNKTFEHVGGETVKTCDVRVLAATNQDLSQMVEKGTFREDLYYRLHVVCLKIPPLRSRRTDIQELVEILMPRICNKMGEAVKIVSPEALQLLCQYNWPGNVRELINILEQIAATVDNMLIQPKHLPEVVLQQERLKQKKLDADIDGDERTSIEAAIKDAGGNKVLAAKVLGIHRSTLYEKLKKYNLQ